MRKDSFLKNSRGTAAIEFALTLSLMFLVLSGVLNFGLILGNQNQLYDVVSAGMLYAFGNVSDPTIVQNIMQNTTNLSPLTVTATKVCLCYPSTNNPSGSPTANACTTSCQGTLGIYMMVNAKSQVNLMALDFVLQNPFITKAEGTIRTN